MIFKNRRNIILFIAAVFSVIVIYIGLYYFIPHLKADNKLVAEFISTGKSDSIFISLPNGKTMLIDGGFSSSLPEVHNTLRKYRVKKIDYLIATHDHDDHIGSFSDILKIYKVGKIYASRSTIENEYKNRFEKLIKEKKIKREYAFGGDVLIDENDIFLKVLSPFEKNKYSDENDYSLVLYLSYKDNSFIFMGDASKKVEGYLMRFYEDELLKTDVIKLGHHGSDTSGAYSFLQKLSPRYAVATNDDKEENKVSNRLLYCLEKLGTTLYETGKSGNITFISDGYNLKINTEK